MELEVAAFNDAVKRSHPAEGWIDGAIGTIEEGSDFADILAPLAAASRAVAHAGVKIVASYLRQCIARPGSTAGTAVTQEYLERRSLALV